MGQGKLFSPPKIARQVGAAWKKKVGIEKRDRMGQNEQEVELHDDGGKKTKTRHMQKLGLGTSQAEDMEINYTLNLNLRHSWEEGGSICQDPGGSNTELTCAWSVKGF